jgi:hypothetical protein
MKINLFFAWYDFWVGWFWDNKKDILYICLLPTIVLSIKFNFCYQIISQYTGEVIGWTFGYDGKKTVLNSEPDVKFKKISKKQYKKDSERE